MTAEVCCSNCIFGDQIVAVVGGRNIDNNCTETRWVLVNKLPIGQTRNCFSHLQKIFGTAGEKFIYPKEDDTCINPKKFKPKEVPDIVY